MQTQPNIQYNSQEARIAELEACVEQLTQERDRLRTAHEKLRLELELLRRRIFLAKAERVDTAQLEFEFAQKLAALDAAAKLGSSANDSQQTPPGPLPRHGKPKGRRDLSHTSLEEERVEISDPLFEQLVATGKAERIGFEESRKLAYKRGGLRQLVLARVKYRAFDSRGESQLETTPMPAQCFPRSLAAPSLLAHIASDKYADGLPLFRIEERFARAGTAVDRGTMSRWLEDAGATLGATVVAAARKEALSTAFCIATDATGVSVQPTPLPDKKRQACRRGHYFVLIADRDHIFYEYAAKQSSQCVQEMLGSFCGYVQADAQSIFDILFRPPDKHSSEDPESPVRLEVGCWSHGRRKFWEAAVTQCAVGREGLVRIGRIFAVDAQVRGKAPAQIKQWRQAHLKPHLDAFFVWAEEQYALVREQRGLLRSALGYVVRQKKALQRVLDDGRLVLENNRSERALRKIATGRKAWLFVGSDDHGTSAGHLFSLIASARLHQLNPEAYLRDLFRVLAHWPKDRYLELAPKYWAITRARLNPAELAHEIGDLTVPPSLTTQEQTATP